MTASQRTITTVGLGLRDETMIRSLVDIAHGRPGPGWRFVDDLDADVALCAPESPLTRVAIARGRQNGRPRCVSFGEAGERTAEFDAVLGVPVRIGDFWNLLESMMQASEGGEGASGAESAILRPELAGRPVAQVVSALIEEKHGGPGRWLLRIGGIGFEVSMPQRMLEIVAPQDCTFDALVEAASTAAVDRVALAPGREAEKPRAGMKSVDVLLWKIGLREFGGPAAAWARDATPVRLRRWPDFGHLGAYRPHLAMTSQLTRAAMTPRDLAAAVGCDEGQVCAFLNACALLGLIQVEPGTARAGVAVARPGGGLGKLMRSFRTALGMGG